MRTVRKGSRSKIGSRRYQDYTEDTLQKCLEDIREGRLSQRAAEKFWNISRSTIKNKLKGVHTKKPGRQPILTEEEEETLVEHTTILCDFGFPITEYALRCVVKLYLDKMGRNVCEFRDNLPGYDWGRHFLERHPELTCRISSNIKRDRAGVDKETLLKYFLNLEKSVEGIPPENMWNYDESNLTDDPGSRKVLSRRGMKHVEQVMDSSKTSTSVMFCGNAKGELLPVYVVYKAEKLWDTWMEGGPKGARFNRSKSGWFDSGSFEDWFFHLVLHRLKRQEGKKLLIGDNLASHISKEVIAACQENDIVFVCLPPHSTHLTQPLDVAFFHPLKAEWRKILHEWRKTPSGERFKTLPKDVFPRLLNKLVGVSVQTRGKI
ncbi:uncharacterized protein LOC134533299 [Bacillus rossius redtenbacheri]|uniref:uncharacterized protein LOC134533299 n=1 Tax=Bacillus rossius redtenbacheri TaxID=93214 RepID=UPI002FDDF596